MITLVNYFCWNQMSRQFMDASVIFCRNFDKRMFFAALYSNYKAAIEMDDVTMMYTMGGEMQ